MSYDFDEMLQSGLLNPYFYKQLTGPTYNILEEPDRLGYVEDAVAMSQLGVSHRDDAAYYLHAFNIGGDWLQDIMGRAVNEPMRRKLAAYMYENRDRFPLTPLMTNLMDSTAIAALDLGLPVNREILQRFIAKPKHPVRRSKKAYPQDWHGSTILPVYDVRRWMKAMRDIYAKAAKIGSFNQALQDVTQNWGDMEKIDFKYWLRFYQEGNQNRYKIARHIPSTEGGYYLPVQSDLVAELPMPPPDINFVPDTKHQPDINDVRSNIEKQRSKIISRLNAAEKLLSSLDGQFFAGEDQEYMLKLLQDLKRKVQTANKIRVRSSLFEDYIFRTANLLNAQGKQRAAVFFYKIAQQQVPSDPTAALLGDAPAPAAESVPIDAQPGDIQPGEAQPDFGELGAMPAPPGESVAKANTRAAFKEFNQLLETGIADMPEAGVEPATSSVVDLTSMTGTASDDDDGDIVVYAQELPEEPLAAPPEAQPAAPGAEQPPAQIDDVIEGALKNITVQDVVRRLELLSGLFKKREIARQLVIIDMMMDRLGIGTFFPSLGEATRSALESNQYVATRLEDVLSKLRGSLDARKSEKFIDQELSAPTPTAPGAEGVAQNLEQQQQEEAERKERRREREEQKLTQPTMEEAAPQELQGPARVEQSRPIPIR